MKVRELIAELMQIEDQDLPIRIYNTDGDETAIDELLNFTPIQNLICFLPERDWKKYKSLIKNSNNGK